VIIGETKYICSQTRILLRAEEFYSENAINFCCGHDAVQVADKT
jgi:hypothetical protein